MKDFDQSALKRLKAGYEMGLLATELGSSPPPHIAKKIMEQAIGLVDSLCACIDTLTIMGNRLEGMQAIAKIGSRHPIWIEIATGQPYEHVGQIKQGQVMVLYADENANIDKPVAVEVVRLVGTTDLIFYKSDNFLKQFKPDPSKVGETAVRT